MLNPIPLLRISALFPFLNFLKEMGSPVEKFLKTSKIPIYSLDTPDIFLSRYQVFNFVEKAAYGEGVPELGMLVGMQTPVKSFGFFSHFIPQSQTLREAIGLTIYAMQLYGSGDKYYLIEREDQAWFCQKYYDLKGQDTYYASHFSLILMLDLIQGAVGKDWYPNAIYLQSRQANIYHHPLSHSQIHTHQETTAIPFPRSFLDLPYLDSHHSSDQSPKETNKFPIHTPSCTFLESLKQAITPQLRESYPSIQLAAEIAQTSVRTLQRQLKKEAITYSQLITQLRHQQAINLLKNSDLKIIDIAAELGYQDPAHFTRAFKQWTGRSPKAFRA